MKKRKLLLVMLAILAISAGGIMYAADHIDSPSVTGTAADITDVYVFRAQDPNNIVFVANTQGLLSPGSTSSAKFDPNTLIEFNIDNNNDNVEDLVIQCLFQNGKMKIYGPVKPSSPGTKSKLADEISAQVEVTPYGSNPIIATGYGGIKVFAGPRDDPFFFDLNQFKKIIGGTESTFHNPGTDTFAGTNVLSVVVEVPKSMLGANSGKINVWLEKKKKI